MIFANHVPRPGFFPFEQLSVQIQKYALNNKALHYLSAYFRFPKVPVIVHLCGSF
jgi:hypothetical protein